MQINDLSSPSEVECKTRLDKPKYLFAPTGDIRDFAIGVDKLPGVFHRFAQRIIFGFKYISTDSLDIQKYGHTESSAGSAE